MAVVSVRWVNDNALSLKAWETNTLARMVGWKCPVKANHPSFASDIFQASGANINFTSKASVSINRGEWHYCAMVFPLNKV